MFARIKETVGSLKFTAVLIISLAVLFLLGLLIPQKELLGKSAYFEWKAAHPLLVAVLDTLRFTNIYSSPLSLLLWALFFLNLVLVMAERIPGLWRRCRMPSLPTEGASLQGGRHYRVVEHKGVDELAAALKGAGYRVTSEGGKLAAVKYRLAPLGTILFHLSFLLLLIGGVATFYTRFRAEADVAVGETFDGGYTKVLQRPKVGSVPPTRFTVTEVLPTYFDRNVTVDLKVALDTPLGRRNIAINRPYRDGALSFIVSDIDVAPLFIVQDAQGKELDSAVVKLKVLQGGEDSFQLLGYTFKTIFHTDYRSEGRSRTADRRSLPQALKQSAESGERSQDKEIVNPAFTVSVFRDNLQVASGMIRPGEWLAFDGYRIAFGDLSYWVHFYAGYERGLMVVYAGFVLMTVALVLRLCFYRREIRAVSEGATLHLAGRGEYFPTLFDEELERILR